MSQNRWKATLPKDAPKEGMVHIVLGTKNNRKSRAEYSGTISEEKAKAIWEILFK